MKDKNIKEIHLAQILCTKLCHDLAGPITGIYNGTELLEESGDDMKIQAMELISSSSKQAAGKLKILRQAYGNLKDGSVSSQELAEIYGDYFGKTKISVEWSGAPLEIEAGYAKILSNIILALANCLPFGGKINIDPADGKKITVSATNNKIKIDEEFEKIFLNKQLPGNLDTKNIHYFFTQTLADALNILIDSSRQETSVKISFARK